MEVNQDIRFVEFSENRVCQEIKPMRGIDFDQEVQRFEQALRLNGIDASGKSDAENIVSNFESALFDKVGEFKMSVDNKLNEMHKLFNSGEVLSTRDLLNAQYQVGMFTVEVSVVSNGSDKVSDGIITLFQTK